MNNQYNPTTKLLSALAVIALSTGLAIPSKSFAEDDMMGQMPNQRQDPMNSADSSDSADSADSTDVDHDHDQMKKDHAKMKRDHKKMMKHNSDANDSKDTMKKMKSKKKMSDPGMMDNDKMGSGGMDHM